MTLSQHLASHGIFSLWNVTHLNNLESLLSRGIVCRNVARQLQGFVDISHPRVQDRRHTTRDVTQGIVFEPHAHVPLFFADNTPMLYVTSSNDAQVILLEISTQVADAPGVVFSDGNIAASDHCLYTDANDLARLAWGIVKSRQPAFSKEWKRKRSAEVLVPQGCSATLFTRVHVQAAVVNGTPVADVARRIVASSGHGHISVRMDLTPQGVS